MDSLTDTVSLAFLRELVDWAEVDPLLTRLADVKQVRKVLRTTSGHDRTRLWQQMLPTFVSS